jgi:hypothetical protein
VKAVERLMKAKEAGDTLENLHFKAYEFESYMKDYTEQDNFTVEDAENIVSLAEDLLTVAKDLKKQIKQVLNKKPK